MSCNQWHFEKGFTFELHADDHASCCIHIEVADTGLMKFPGQELLFEQFTVMALKIHERRNHRIDVEVVAIMRRMRTNATIRYHQSFVIRHQQQFMWTDAITREFLHASEIGGWTLAA